MYIKERRTPVAFTDDALPRLAEIRDNGLTVVLTNGSRWEVTLEASVNLRLWQPAVEVFVEVRDKSEFPWALINMETGSIVRARNVAPRQSPSLVTKAA